MAQINVEELYCGEGRGAKYGLGGTLAAEQMKNEGGFVSEVTEPEPPSCHGEDKDENS